MFMETFFRFQTFSFYLPLLSLIPCLYLLLWLPHTPSFIISSQGDWTLPRFPLYCCNLWAFSRQLVGHNHRVHLIVSLFSRIIFLHCMVASVLRVCQLFKFFSFSDRELNLISSSLAGSRESWFRGFQKSWV